MAALFREGVGCKRERLAARSIKGDTCAVDGDTVAVVGIGLLFNGAGDRGFGHRVLEGDAEDVLHRASGTTAVIGSADLDVDGLTIGVATGGSAESQGAGIEAEPSWPCQGSTCAAVGRWIPGLRGDRDQIVIGVREGTRRQSETLRATGFPDLVIHWRDFWGAADNGHQRTIDRRLAVGIE